MVISLTGQILFLSGLAIAGLLVHRVIKLELTLACLVVGFLAGQSLAFINFDTGIRAHNLQDIVFFIILPILIFEAAWHLKPEALKRWLFPILILATFGVLISCAIAAALVFFGIGHPAGFPWIAALLTGAILAATDPIAVISQLRSLNAPEDLATLFEGESLFNDATAIVLFSIVMMFAAQTPTESINYVSFFAKVFFGGIVIGVISGIFSSAITVLISNSIASRFILVFTAFASFYVAEHLLHVSGILAVMFAALTTRIALNKADKNIIEGTDATWEWLGLFFNSLLFVLMGLVITIAMFTQQWLAMLIAIVASLLARTAAVSISGLIVMPTPQRIPFGWQILLIWGGLRGAIAIALVLSLPTSLPYWWTIQSMVFGVVVFSLLVQGTTNKGLLKKFGSSM